jgi:hypothetical protein
MERKWFSSTMSMTNVVIHNNIDVHVGILNFVHAHMISLENLFLYLSSFCIAHNFMHERMTQRNYKLQNQLACNKVRLHIVYSYVVRWFCWNETRLPSIFGLKPSKLVKIFIDIFNSSWVNSSWTLKFSMNFPCTCKLSHVRRFFYVCFMFYMIFVLNFYFASELISYYFPFQKNK